MRGCERLGILNEPMDPAAQIARVAQALGEIGAVLARAAPSPRTRELKTRAITFERALMNFAGRVPRADQARALLEGVMELHARVLAGHAPPASQAAPVPARGASVRGMPAMPTAPAMHALMTSSRPALTAVRSSQAPTMKPPPPSPNARTVPVPPGTVPPPSSRRR
jgi:hypothetical protein